MRVERTDINGNKISREEIHEKMYNNKICNEIITNTINTIKDIKDERK